MILDAGCKFAGSAGADRSDRLIEGAKPSMVVGSALCPMYHESGILNPETRCMKHLSQTVMTDGCNITCPTPINYCFHRTTISIVLLLPPYYYLHRTTTFVVLHLSYYDDSSNSCYFIMNLESRTAARSSLKSPRKEGFLKCPRQKICPRKPL